MSDKERCSRSYQMRQRETGMEATRSRVLVAARELILGENALDGFSLEAVARQAGVTRVTIYHRFGSKRGLLEALFDEVGEKGRLGEKLPMVFAHHDAMEALREYVRVFCEFWEMDRVLNRRLRGFAALDADFASAIAERYQRRHQAFDILLRRLGHQNVSADTIQTLLSLTGFEFYDVLATEDLAPHEAAVTIFGLVLSVLNK